MNKFIYRTWKIIYATYFIGLGSRPHLRMNNNLIIKQLTLTFLLIIRKRNFVVTIYSVEYRGPARTDVSCRGALSYFESHFNTIGYGTKMSSLISLSDLVSLWTLGPSLLPTLMGPSSACSAFVASIDRKHQDLKTQN